VIRKNLYSLEHLVTFEMLSESSDVLFKVTYSRYKHVPEPERLIVIFKPLGFGQWQSAVATILGLMAKEEIVGVFGTLGGTAESAFNEILGGKLAGYSFMIFNLLCAPCFAAIGAIRREMNNWKWSVGTIAYMCGFAYAISLMVYQFGLLFAFGKFSAGTVFAVVVLAVMLYMLVRPNPNKKKAII
jgi:ferrous iron transport protein B